MAFIKRKKEQMHQNNIVYKKNRLQSILLSQDGMGVVEVILIIVVLIGLVIIFQTNIKGGGGIHFLHNTEKCRFNTINILMKEDRLQSFCRFCFWC